MWSTAYYALRYNSTKRKFYFLQDYEPIFYPAGSICAQVQSTYRFGFYGIANTSSVKEAYEQSGGIGQFFVPAVDTGIFHPAEGDGRKSGEPYTVFFYGRPEHPRNGFELGAAAMRRLKARMEDRVRIVAAGAAWHPSEFGLKAVLENRGMLSYQQTAELYCHCHAGLAMMFTRHPSYLPFELMASGCLVVSNHNPATTWFLKDRENCILSGTSASQLAETLERALLDEKDRTRITANALDQVQKHYSRWEDQIERMYEYMRDPQSHCGQERGVGIPQTLGGERIG